jgi:hypothetical protein
LASALNSVEVELVLAPDNIEVERALDVMCRLRARDLQVKVVGSRGRSARLPQSGGSADIRPALAKQLRV